jgi:hypothetical protein
MSAQARRKKIPKTNKNFLEGNMSGGLPPQQNQNNGG